MFDTIELKKEKQEELRLIEENQYNDIKSKMILPAKISETVSAFANASGGDIYIGIREETRTKSRYIEGFNRIEDTNDYIRVLETIEGLNGNYSVSYLMFLDKTYCMNITIFKAHSIVKSTKKEIFIRKGAQNLKCDGQENIRRLELDKGIFPYENEKVVESDIADAMNSLIYSTFAKEVIPNIEKFNWLRAQKLCIDTSLNVAGTLLFTDEPQTVLPKCSAIKIFRYKTTGEGTRQTLDGDPITVEGCIYTQIYDAVKKVKEIIESIKKLNDKFNDIQYPETTLHEIITNAVLHRDYSIIKDIQIRIFDNRVEIESPGRLAGHITLKNILNEQFSRNPKIVRLINKFPHAPNKDVGEGLNTAFKAMQELRLKEPEIRETDGSVIVIIRHEKLASPEETVMEYLNSHDEITNKTGREITGIESENTMKRVFWALRDANYIEQVPGRKGSRYAWRKKANASEFKVQKDTVNQMSLFD